ncbi:transcription elongation factor A protein 1-like [Tigriopus californicus]|uniref:transcription elongation factor A protein 1-like n=1 Tax=Tigriopus californicus TaxID=6832 RepID=UPI0027DAA1F7|nr:transcription elongation factor A protein 1-like [Tigriopus californicus]
MGVEEEVMSLRKQLEKCTPSADNADPDQSGVLDLLQSLSQLKMNLNILSTTRIGMTVNALRKSSKDEEVITLAKSLIKTWKKFVPETNAAGDKAKEKKKDDVKRKDDKHGSQDGNGSRTDEALVRSFPSKPQATADEVRLRCRDMLSKALRGEADTELPDGMGQTVEDIAELIEDALFKKFKDTGMRYKNQIRSRVFNLKDKKNPALRENVLTGVIPPDTFSTMSAEDMASDEVKNQRKAFVKAGIDAAQLAKVEGTKTDLLQCGKCHKKNCTYNQIQTRSADEPMTTFVLCNACGNRWKFC